MTDLYLWEFASLLAALLRQFVAIGGMVVASADIGAAVRFLPLLILVAAAIRQFAACRPWLGLTLVLVDLYFLYNRLSVFIGKPLVLGEVVGMIGLSGLGVWLLLLPRKERKL